MTDLRHRITHTDIVNACDLTANPKNWRTHPKHQRDALIAVLDRVGEVAPVLVNERTGLLVDGHLRVEIAAARGDSVQANYVDLSSEEEALILATLDPLSAMAGQDDAKQMALLETLRAENDAALNALLDQTHGTMAGRLPHDDATEDVPPAPADPVTQPGDVVRLGAHVLVCGDARVAADVARALGTACADCVWTDPPYGVDYVGGMKPRDRITNDGLPKPALEELLRRSFAVALACCVPGAPWYVSGPGGPLTQLFGQVLLDLHLAVDIGLGKNNMALGHSDYRFRHEPIFYGWTPGERHVWLGGRSATSVFECDRPTQPIYIRP